MFVLLKGHTNAIRPTIPSSKVDPSFISYVRPDYSLIRLEVANVRTLLRASSDSDVFKAHSEPGTLATATANSNVPLSEILRKVDWSTPSTFQKFYYKPIHSTSFAHAFLHCHCLYLHAHHVLGSVTLELYIITLLLLTLALFIFVSALSVINELPVVCDRFAFDWHNFFALNSI